ncbi:MAG: ADP-ribosylglycohydrolase family protein [Puniceicoccales bacterium]|jgi:ADP-ribosylglycohydrolase|nr:ADP-ribosylglycohydrolase family protein [Puniceicoccales bacterium]
MNAIHPKTPNIPTLRSRFLGAWWGLFIGDALAIPTHGYYSADQIAHDYGEIDSYTPIKEPHPNSEMVRIQFSPRNEKDNLLHHRTALWKKPGTHYHHGLNPGDNSLPFLIAQELAGSICDKDGQYDEVDFIDRYLHLMLSPDGHRDTYIPSAHRKFFSNYGSGRPIEKCGENNNHVAGLIEAAPILLTYCGSPSLVNRLLKQHISIARPSGTLIHCAEFLAELLILLCQGNSLEDSIYKKLGHLHHPYLAYPYHRWIANQDDITVATKNLSQGALADDAVPLAIYLSLKYANNTEHALMMNANIGGDSCNRAGIIGMLLGAQNGCESISSELATGLTNYASLDKLGDTLWEFAKHSWGTKIIAPQ